MRIFGQILGAALVAAVALVLWARLLPASHPVLERLGLLQPMVQVGLVPDPGEAGAGADAGEAGAGQSGGQSAGVAVRLAEVQEGRLNDLVMAIGDGRALRSVRLRAEATGRVTRIGATAGAMIQPGAMLMELEDRAERLARDRAALLLRDARAEAERVGKLAGTGAVTDLRRQEAELALGTAELALEEAEIALSRRQLLAPIGGWIGLWDIEEGDRVAAGDEIAVITDRSQIVIEFRVPERLVGKLASGDALRAEPLASPGDWIEGRILAVDNVVDRTSRSLRVQALVPNEGDRLRAGMAFRVEMEFTGEPMASVDPLAVQWALDGAYVWAVRDGKAERVSVTIRQRDAGAVLVEGALAPGDRVVREGVQNLRPGSPVSPAAPVGDASVTGAAIEGAASQGARL